MSIRLVSLCTFYIVLSVAQVESDGPSGEECTAIGGARGEKDMAAASPSEVVVDVREVKQGDYVRVTLRSSKKIMGFLLLAYGRNQSAPLGSWYIPHQEKSALPIARYLDCDGVRRSGVSHAGTDGFFRLNLQWRPPYDYVGRLTIKAKLIVEGSDMWTSLSSLPIEVLGRSGKRKVSSKFPTKEGDLEKNISSFPIEVVGWGGEGRALPDGEEDVDIAPASIIPVTASTSPPDSSWKSVLIGGGQRSEGNQGDVRPRFLNEDGGWDRWDAWEPPNKDQEVTSKRPLVAKEKDVWDRWEAWTAPDYKDPATTRRVLIGANRRNGAAENWDRWDQGATQSWDRLDQPSWNMGTWDRLDRPGENLRQEEVSRTRDRATANWWEKATQPLLEETTTWRSVLMMPKKRRATKAPTKRRRTSSAVTQRNAVSWSSTKTSDVDRAAIEDEEFYTSVELEERKEEERGKYELMKADFGSWDTKSAVTRQGPLGSALFSAILILLASS